MSLRENRWLDEEPYDARNRPELRNAQAELLERAALLDQPDRLLVELAIKHRYSTRQIGRLMHAPGGTIYRRLRRLLNRLHDPLVIALLRPNCPLRAEFRQIAIENALIGRGLRELADQHQLTTHQVRQMLEYARGWHRGVSLTPSRFNGQRLTTSR